MKTVMKLFANNRLMTMIALSFIICHLSFSPARAQKFALVDMEYILKNIPAYERANEQLNQTSKQWQAEVDALTTEAQTLYKNYQNEVVFLSKEQKKAKQDAIVSCRPSKTRSTMPSRTSPTPEATNSCSTVPVTQASSSAPRRSTSLPKCSANSDTPTNRLNSPPKLGGARGGLNKG